MGKLTKILIANRGEIACRVIRTAKAKGYRTVAVYSEADAGALHVAMADEAVCIGPPPVGESYLVIEKILSAARDTGADAIHPGYGFLSENAEFSRACAEAGITFIGPSAEAIDLMGNKAAAKRKMAEADVDCVPGYEGESQEDATLQAEAEKIGFPIMIKAAAGGGGRGMRLVESPDAMKAALERARSEAENAFGSGELILEKAIVNPRHVEIQVVGDTHGNVIHLGERDCSIQRRHQKVIEESPCPIMTEELRAAMGEAAVKAAQSIDYVGAGTIEFLLDADGKFYFLEMNTRLQVEHPVTELVTGVDLVAMQLDIAEGGSIGDLGNRTPRGHAIEARLYAEDPSQDFLPQSGKVLVWEPASGEGVRVDHGLHSDSEVSPYYDPMIAKVVGHGATREEARRKLIAALRETKILGVTTNKQFLCEALSHETFIQGSATTSFIGEDWTPESAASASSNKMAALAGVIAIETAPLTVSPILRGWRSTRVLEVPIIFEQGEDRIVLSTMIEEGLYRVNVGEEEFRFDAVSIADGVIHFDQAGAKHRSRFAIDDDAFHLDWDGRTASFVDVTFAPAEAPDASRDGLLRSPMNGKVIAIQAAAGDAVTKDQVLVIVEAMKMENQVLAPMDGVVEAVSVQEGDQVETRQVLMTVKSNEEE